MGESRGEPEIVCLSARVPAGLARPMPQASPKVSNGPTRARGILVLAATHTRRSPPCMAPVAALGARVARLMAAPAIRRPSLLQPPPPAHTPVAPGRDVSLHLPCAGVRRWRWSSWIGALPLRAPGARAGGPCWRPSLEVRSGGRHVCVQVSATSQRLVIASRGTARMYSHPLLALLALSSSLSAGY